MVTVVGGNRGGRYKGRWRCGISVSPGEGSVRWCCAAVLTHASHVLPTASRSTTRPPKRNIPVYCHFIDVFVWGTLGNILVLWYLFTITGMLRTVKEYFLKESTGYHWYGTTSRSAVSCDDFVLFEWKFHALCWHLRPSSGREHTVI